MDEDGVTITGEWTYTPVEVPTHTVEFTEKSDDENTDPGAETITITNGDKIIVDPNGGDWTYGGTTYTDGEKAEIVITEDISIPDPERDGYEFTGWTVTEEDGVTVLKANWEKKNNWIIPVVVAGTVGGVITGAVIAGGIATAITGGVLAVPAAVLIGKAIKDNASDNNQTDNSGNNSNSDMPDTGSTSPKLAAFALVSSAAAAAYVILSRKKEED